MFSVSPVYRLVSYLLGPQTPNQGYFKTFHFGNARGWATGAINKQCPGHRPDLTPLLVSHQLKVQPPSPRMVPHSKTQNQNPLWSWLSPQRLPSRLCLINPQSHSANQKGQNALTSPTSNVHVLSAYCIQVLSCIHHILNAEKGALDTDIISKKHLKKQIRRNFRVTQGRTLRKAVPLPTL